MKKALAIVGLLFLALPIFGQMAAAPKPQYYLIHEEIVRPNMLAQYEATTREFFNLLGEQKVDPKVFGVNTYVTTDMHYVFVAPISNFSGVDSIYQVFMNLGQGPAKDRFNDLTRRGNATMYSYNEFVAVRRDDLSYVPATPRLKPEERRFVHWQFYYLDGSRMSEAEQIARDYVTLFKSKNIPDGFTIFEALSGNDLPLWVVASTGRSAADYYSNDEKNLATLGADVRPLQARALAVTRKYEVKDGTARTDIGYPIPAAK